MAEIVPAGREHNRLLAGVPRPPIVRQTSAWHPTLRDGEQERFQIVHVPRPAGGWPPSATDDDDDSEDPLTFERIDDSDEWAATYARETRINDGVIKSEWWGRYLYRIKD